MSIQLVPLGEVVRPSRAKVKPAEKPELPFIGMEHVEAHSMRLLGTVPAHTMKSAAVHFKPGDVLYGRLRPYLNKVYRPTFEGLCSAEFIVLPETERLHGGYLQYFLNSAAFANFAAQLNAGDRPRVDFDQLAAHAIPLPPTEQQRTVVAEIEKQFSRLDEAVANLQRVQSNLRRYRASVLQAAVEGRLVESQAAIARREGRTYENGQQLLTRLACAARHASRSVRERLGPDATSQDREIPEGWHLASAEHVCSQITDGEHIQPRYQAAGDPLLTARNVRDGYVSLEGAGLIGEADFQSCLKRCAPTEGDILVVSVGATTGRAAIVGRCRPFALVRSVLLLRPLIVPRFLLAVVQSPGCQTYIRGASGSTAQAHLYIKDTRRMPVPVPPLAEQERIVAEVDRRLSIVRELEAEVDANLKRAQALRQATLAKAFTP